MYLRVAHLHVKPGKRRELREFYQQRVMTALAETPGCLHAALLEGVDQTDDWLSATFWKSFDDAEDYEESGLPDRLIEELEGVLEHEKQWKVELSQNMHIGYDSAMRAIEVEGFSIEDSGGRVDPRSGPQPDTYVRMVSVKADPAKIEEFKERRDQVVIPALEEVKGCRFTFLSEGIRDRHHMLSVSIWDSQQAALKYEVSGRFDAITRKLQDTMARDHEWKMALGRSVGTGLSTDPELQVRGYEIVVSGRVG